MAMTWRERIASAVDNFTARPGQTLLRIGAGIAGSALAGPAAGNAASTGLGRWFDARNNRHFTDSANALNQSSARAIGAGVPWGINGELGELTGSSPDSGYTYMGDEVNSGPPAPGGLLPLISVSPNGLSSISGGGARDAFAGTSGSSDWGATFASLGMQGSSGGSRNSMAGPTAIADSLAGQSALRNRLREQLRQNPDDQSALALREQMRANRGAGR